jgi:hypothetical protein
MDDPQRTTNQKKNTTMVVPFAGSSGMAIQVSQYPWINLFAKGWSRTLPKGFIEYSKSA